ncbi:hypothetical protein [Bacillus gobiensis]|uniref:hypothetical protein n=1 Tax=Bacillus gobiensis TaxID=1441095 RepID=UPI003D2175CA
MLLEPCYAEHIIIGVIHNNSFEWYVTEKELWFLDYNKLDDAYQARGFDKENLLIPSEREDIEVLDQRSLDKFLSKLTKHKASKNDLYKILNDAVQSEEYDDLLDFSPSLLVDFNDQKLYSMFPEPASFEEYVPKGWIGELRDFTESVPVEEKYWIDSNGNNLFKNSNGH